MDDNLSNFISAPKCTALCTSHKDKAVCVQCKGDELWIAVFFQQDNTLDCLGHSLSPDVAGSRSFFHWIKVSVISLRVWKEDLNFIKNISTRQIN